MPGSVLSIILLGIDVEIEAQRGKVICLRLHSSYMPEPIFEPKRSRFMWQHQVLASRHSGPSTWEGTAPKHFLPRLANAYDVESAYGIRGRTPAPLLKAVQSLPTILYTLLSSPQFSLPSQNFSFLCVPTAAGAHPPSPCALGVPS